MINRKTGILAVLLCLWVCLIPCYAYAASTTEAVEPIAPENLCSLTVSYGYGEMAFADVQVKVYRIAGVSADFQYTLTRTFRASNLILNGIQSTGEWNVIRSTLEAYILAQGVEADVVAVTNQNGQACFDALQTGLYLVVVSPIDRDGYQYLFDSVLVSLPGLEQDGYWQYQVVVNAKGEVMPPVESDEEIELKILKLWKGDEGRNDRPKSVEVEIYRDGVHYKTVLLAEGNYWSYSWTAKNDGTSWTVVERNVPEGYTMTVETRDTSFVLTNTRISTPQEDPEKPPQTGDTSNVLLHIWGMTLSGIGLLALGLTGKKKRL